MSARSQNQIVKALREAHAKGRSPEARHANLRDADLRDADLRDADLRGADLRNAGLRSADLRNADLRDADLRGANLSNAGLRSADLRHADLRGADLRNANLCYARLIYVNLRYADLTGAELTDTCLAGANLYRVKGGLLAIDGLHPYRITVTPLLTGWNMTIGCWSGTSDDLRELIARDTGWPEACGDAIADRRPKLELAAAMCDLHAKSHSGLVDRLNEQWNTGL